MLYRARIALLLLSALSAHLVPACGRSYGRDRDVARATSAPDHGSFALAATAGAANTAATVINGDVVLNPTATCNAVPVGASGTFGLCGGAAPSVNGTVVTPTYPNTTLAQQVTDALRAAYLSITPPTGPPAAGSLGAPLPDDVPNMHAWRERVVARPAVRAVLADMNDAAARAFAA